MKTKNTCLLILLYLLLTPSFSHADNNQVATWTQQTLLDTMSLNYQNLHGEFMANKVNYSDDAWAALKMFLGNSVTLVKQNDLVLHPVVMNQAQVVAHGYFSGIDYWRVNVTIAIPELGGNVAFSVLVLKANDPPYMIQSMNMVLNK